MNFFDQYKSPEWQKKRLEVLQKAEFHCQRCFDAESQLHVHHKRYVKGRKVWDYTDDELEVLCDSCHSIVHEEKQRLQDFFVSFPSEALDEFYWLLLGYSKDRHGPSGFSGYQDAPENKFDQRIYDIGSAAALCANDPVKEGIKNG